MRPESNRREGGHAAGHTRALPFQFFLGKLFIFLRPRKLICLANTNDILLFFREKLKMKEREEAWVKIENLAKANPQVLKRRVA